MSSINLAIFDTAKATPTISRASCDLLMKMPKRFNIYSLRETIDSFQKSQTLYENTQRNPIKAKILSLLAAGCVISLIIGGALGAHYASTLLTTAQDTNVAVAFGIACGTVVVANVVGAYFNHRWHGYCPEGDDYASPFYMSFLGIITPIWRAFSGSLEKSRDEGFERVGKSYNSKTYQKIRDWLDSQSQSPEVVKAKEELQAAYDFFSEGASSSQYIELDSLNG